MLSSLQSQINSPLNPPRTDLKSVPLLETVNSCTTIVKNVDIVLRTIILVSQKVDSNDFSVLSLCILNLDPEDLF